MEKMEFQQFCEQFENGQEIINEGSLPTKTVVALIRGCSWSINQIQNPTMDSVANYLGMDYNEDIGSNADFLKTYEAVSAAFTKAKTAFVKTLSEELKKVK